MKTKTRLHILSVAGLSCIFAATALGLDQTWNTSGPSDTWNTTDLNWDAGVFWTNGNTAVFTGTGETVTVATVTAAGTTLSGTGYTLSGGDITHSGAITANESATVNSNIALSANQAWTVAADKTLTLGGTISGTSTLTYGGAGSYVIGGINPNSGNLTISGATVKVNTGATLFCNGLGWSPRSVTLSNGGTLEAPNFGNGSGFLWGQCGDGANNVILQSGGVFKMTGATMDSTVNKGFDVTASQTGYFRVPTGTSTVWGGRNTGRDFNSNTGATLVFDGGGNFETGRYIRGAGNVTKNDAGTLKLTNTNAFTGALTINGGTLEATAATGGGNASAIGNGATTINVAQGATLLFSTNARTAGYHSGTVNLNGGTITFNTADNSFASGKTITFDTAAGTMNGSGQWRMRDTNAKVVVNAAASGSTISVSTLTLTFAISGGYVFDVADGAQANDLTISSTIAGHNGNEAITKNGAGTLLLTGTSTNSGTTIVNAGTLLVNGSLASPVTLNSGTLGGTGSVSGTVTINTATLAGSGTFAGLVTANASAVIAGTQTFNGPVNVNASAVIEPAGEGMIGTLTANNTLSLAGETRMEITKSGATLDSDRIAGTGSVIFGGVLTITATGDAPQLGDTFQLFTGTGDFLGAFSSIAPPALPAGLSWDVSQVAVNGTITVVNYAAVPLFSKPAGAYVGGQFITLSSEDGATIYYTLDGSAPTLSSTSGTSPVTGIEIPNSSTMTLRAFATKPGQANSPEVSAVYTTIPIGVWNVDDNGLWSESAKWLASAIPDGAENPVDFQTTAQTTDTTVTLDSNRTVGAMTFGNANPINWTINATNGAVLTLDNGASTPAVTVASNTATLAVPLAGTNGLALAGAGTLVLSGANTYGGDTTVASGSTLRLGASNTLPDGSGKGNLALAGTLDPAGFSDTVNGLTGEGPVVKSGSGNSTLTIGGGGATSTYDGVISNTEGVLSLGKTGAGTLTLTAVHAYTGGTTVGGGTLELPVGSSIGTATSGRVNIAAGTLQLNGGSVTSNGTGVFLADGAPATLDFSAGSLTMNAPNQWWDVVVGNYAAATWNQTGGTADLNLGGLYVGNWEAAGGTAINLSGGVFSINGTAETGDRRLILSVRSNATLTVSGTSVATVPSLEYGHSPAVSPAGVTGTTHLNGGTLVTNTVRNPGTRGAIFNFNGGLLKVYDASSTLMAGLTTANVRDGGARIDTNGQTSTITQALLHSTIDGDSATDGGLTKSGAGTLILTASSDFTGNTTVDEGTLQVDGALTAGPQVTVATGATLGGSGSISGNVVADGSIAPGASVGTLATGSVDLTGGTYACEIDGAAADRLNITGDLDLTGATLSVTVLNPATFTQAVILTYTGTLTGDFGTPSLPSGITLEHDATAKEFRLVREGDFFVWANANGVTGGPNGDSDNDGIRNLVEYALALNPAASDGQAGSYNPATGEITFTKRQDAIDNGDVTYIIETSPDLTSWSPAVTHGPGNTAATITTTLTVDGPQKFARLSVTTSATAP